VKEGWDIMGRKLGSKNKHKIMEPAGISDIPKEVVAEAIQLVKEKREAKNTLDGWVNIYRFEREGKIDFFSGTDIHRTQDAAKFMAQRGCIGQTYISVEVK
jgi:hypothetical protein